MDTCPVNAYVRLTRARQQWTGAARQRVCRQVGPYVEPEDAICPIALEYAALTHRLGATGRFLGRLKHKEHVALDGTRLLTNRSVDKSRRRERHGHVTVVTAPHASCPGCVEAKAAPVASAMGRASMSARIAVACAASVPASKKRRHSWDTDGHLAGERLNTPSI